MESKTTAKASDIQKALGLKGILEDINIAVNGQVSVSVLLPKVDFLKAMKLSGELNAIETATTDEGVITEVVITSIVDASAPAKRGRKPKNTVVTP